MEAFIKRNDSVATTLITHDEISIPKDEISVPCRRIIPRRNSKSFAVNFCKSTSAPTSGQNHSERDSKSSTFENCQQYDYINWRDREADKLGKFDPPARADSKLRWKTGARFKITHHQKHNLESVPPQQKNHEGIRELDLACDQKSPASPAASKEPVRRIQLHFRSTCFCFTPPIYLRWCHPPVVKTY